MNRNYDRRGLRQSDFNRDWGFHTDDTANPRWHARNAPNVTTGDDEINYEREQLTIAPKGFRVDHLNRYIEAGGDEPVARMLADDLANGIVRHPVRRWEMAKRTVQEWRRAA